MYQKTFQYKNETWDERSGDSRSSYEVALGAEKMEDVIIIGMIIMLVEASQASHHHQVVDVVESTTRDLKSNREDGMVAFIDHGIVAVAVSRTNHPRNPMVVGGEAGMIAMMMMIGGVMIGGVILL